MAHDVFISYSSKDKPVADAVCAGLEGRGLRCWIAPRDILPGVDWGAAIIDAIAGSKVMVLIFSGNANTSQQIKREVERAVAKGVKILPFRIEDVPLSKSLEYFISTGHWLDALTQPLDGHIVRLGDSVGALVARDSRQGEPPRPATPLATGFAPSPGSSRRLTPPLLPAPRPSLRGVYRIAAALAVVAVLYALLRKAPPRIVAINFPASFNAGSRDVPGTVQFKTGHDPIARAQFDVVSAQSFDPFTVEPRGIGAKKEGTFPFSIHSSDPQQVVLKAMLIDSQGRRSSPVSFSFEVKKAAPGHTFEIAPPRFKIRLPH